jgi:hypothetical protein
MFPLRESGAGQLIAEQTAWSALGVIVGSFFS